MPPAYLPPELVQLVGLRPDEFLQVRMFTIHATRQLLVHARVLKDVVDDHSLRQRIVEQQPRLFFVFRRQKKKKRAKRKNTLQRNRVTPQE